MIQDENTRHVLNEDFEDIILLDIPLAAYSFLDY